MLSKFYATLATVAILKDSSLGYELNELATLPLQPSLLCANKLLQCPVLRLDKVPLAQWLAHLLLLLLLRLALAEVRLKTFTWQSQVEGLGLYRLKGLKSQWPNYYGAQRQLVVKRGILVFSVRNSMTFVYNNIYNHFTLIIITLLHVEAFYKQFLFFFE